MRTMEVAHMTLTYVSCAWPPIASPGPWQSQKVQDLFARCRCVCDNEKHSSTAAAHSTLLSAAQLSTHCVPGRQWQAGMCPCVGVGFFSENGARALTPRRTYSICALHRDRPVLAGGSVHQYTGVWFNFSLWMVVTCPVPRAAVWRSPCQSSRALPPILAPAIKITRSILVYSAGSVRTHILKATHTRTWSRTTSYADDLPPDIGDRFAARVSSIS